MGVFGSSTFRERSDRICMRMYTAVAIKPTSLSVSIGVCIAVAMHGEGAQEWSVH